MISNQVEQWLTNRLSEVLGVSDDQLTGSTSLDQLGLDSMSRIALIDELSQVTGQRVRPEDAAYCDTISSLAAQFGGGEE
jgi:acyl carrier protein